jgi:hypothetical protein
MEIVRSQIVLEHVVRRLPLGDIVCVLFTRSVSEDGVTDIPFSYDRDQPHQSFVIADRVRSQPIKSFEDGRSVW